MPVLSFPAYETHEEGRVEANDAMMALLVGSRLSGHVLSLMDGSAVFLTEAFPRVPGIKRLNVKVPEAQSLLENAELHLAFMAIPYSVSIHEDFLNSCVDMLCHARETKPEEVSFEQRKLGNLYATLEGLGLTIDNPVQVALFDLARRIRNRIVHNRGHAGSVLSYYQSTQGVAGGWSDVAKRDLDRDDSGRLRLAAPELFACLAVLKRLADMVNLALQGAIPEAHWARLAVDEYLRGGKQGNPNQNTRRLAGFVAHRYAPLDIPWEVVQAAAVNRGIELA